MRIKYNKIEVFGRRLRLDSNCEVICVKDFSRVANGTEYQFANEITDSIMYDVPGSERRRSYKADAIDYNNKILVYWKMWFSIYSNIRLWEDHINRITEYTKFMVHGSKCTPLWRGNFKKLVVIVLWIVVFCWTNI